MDFGRSLFCFLPSPPASEYEIRKTYVHVSWKMICTWRFFPYLFVCLPECNQQKTDPKHHTVFFGMQIFEFTQLKDMNIMIFNDLTNIIQRSSITHAHEHKYGFNQSA